MKQSDLRIGNWIHFPFHGEDVKVIGLPLRADNVKCIQVETLGTQLCEPLLKQFKSIKLTEEWLVKFGFSRLSEDCGLFMKSFFNVEKWNDDTFRYTTESSFSFEIKTVHQLQNLYFAICNKELEFIEVKYAKCQDSLRNELKEGDRVDVQKAGIHTIYKKKEDGQLYFQPYGEEERVSFYFSNDLTKV
jgi:hypothetical protein